MIRIVPVYPITQEMYINYFGGKTSLNKADRAYISKKSKTDLFNEASSLGLMVDEQLTKQQIYNLIKRLKEEQAQALKQAQAQALKQAQALDMQDLLEHLPTNIPKRISEIRQEPYREPSPLESIPAVNKTIKKQRPRGSKDTRAHQGLSKQEKTASNIESKKSVDDVSDLFSIFTIREAPWQRFGYMYSR
jgi:hypothetical protein